MKLYCLCVYAYLDEVFNDKCELIEYFKVNSRDLLSVQGFRALSNKTNDEIFEILENGYEGCCVITRYLNDSTSY